MQTDRRLMPRYAVGLPIVIDGMVGTTRDIGVNGVSFVAPRALALDDRVTFSIALDAQPAGLLLDCAGVVKRSMPTKDGQFEIVVTIDRLDLKPSASRPAAV